jgi:hypothetical protein
MSFGIPHDRCFCAGEWPILAWIILAGAAGKKLLDCLILVPGRNRGFFGADFASPEGVGGTFAWDVAG